MSKGKVISTTIIAVGLLMTVLYLVLNPNPCGYSDHRGNLLIECKCVGYKRPQQDKKGPIISLGTVDVCYGHTTTRICFENSKPVQAPEPHLCI